MDKYNIIQKISGNNFNCIYKAIHNITEEIVIIKTQSKHNEANTLKNEALIYNYIHGAIGFPTLKYYGCKDDTIIMVLSQLDKNLADIKKIHNTISISMVLYLGIQMIERISFFHNLKLLHRDIKPENFMIGFGNKKNILHMIDFGFSKKYIDENENHIPLKNIHNIIGTPYFVSMNILKGIEPSRRDDIESIIYVLLFLFLDDKIWLNIHNNNNKSFNIRLLYENTYIPKVFIYLLDYVYALEYEETPNYSYMIKLMNQE